MANKSIASTKKSDFRSTIPNYSDEEILVILKKRKQYQPEAAELAINEAIKRGLINSEQDLFSEEFQENKSESFLFPEIIDNKNKNKIRKSISRILLIIGALPVIWGALEIGKSNLIEGVLLILLGSIWIYASAQLMRSLQTKMVNILFIMLFASGVYILKLLLELKGLAIMDYFIPTILISLIIYGLLFVRRLK
ncbi:MAG: hypothetical protein GQ525_02580 [Draconibacterium sp.]|nr:hypothetical protein [Draconibacterium sp.]